MASSVTNQRSFWTGDYDAQTLSIIITCSISLYNALELSTWIAATFNQARGLYFWSLLIATLGLLPYNVGIIVAYFQLCSKAIGMTLGHVGWSATITGQSLVLYSRLAFIMNDKRILKAIKWIIIVNGVTWHPSTSAIHYCSQYGPDYSQAGCSMAYSVVEKVQMTIFCLQEFMISGIYLWQTARLLNSLHRQKTRKVLQELFLINFSIIIMDIGLLIVEFLNYLALEGAIKVFIYSVKLKVEFLILGKLLDLVRAAACRSHRPLPPPGLVQVQPQDSDQCRAREGGVMPKWLWQVEEYGVGETADGQMAGPGMSASWGSMTVEERRRRQLTQRDPYAEALRSLSTRAEGDGNQV